MTHWSVPNVGGSTDRQDLSRNGEKKVKPVSTTISKAPRRSRGAFPLNEVEMNIPLVCDHATIWLYRKNEDCFSVKTHIRIYDSTLKIESALHGSRSLIVALRALADELEQVLPESRLDEREF